MGLTKAELTALVLYQAGQLVQSLVEPVNHGNYPAPETIELLKSRLHTALDYLNAIGSANE